MSRIEFATIISLPVAVASSFAMIFHFTRLPLWGAALIALPVGGVIGILMGFVLGIAVDFVSQKLK